MISGLIVSGALLFTTHQFWKENAVVITLDTMAVPVSEIPFPAVTVCESVDSVTRVEPWHLPMKIMDRLTFYCDKSGRMDRYLPNCEEAKNRTYASTSVFRGGAIGPWPPLADQDH